MRPSMITDVSRILYASRPHRLEELRRHVLELVALGEGHRGAQIGEEQAEETPSEGSCLRGDHAHGRAQAEPQPQAHDAAEGAPEDPVDRNTTRLPFEEHGEHAE